MAHQPIALHPCPVIGEQPHTSRSHLRQWGQLFTFAADRDGPSDMHIDQRGSLAQLTNLTYNADRVDSRVGIGHCDDGRVTAKRCSTTTGFHRFGGLVARLT
jgi:hypothetical protein